MIGVAAAVLDREEKKSLSDLAFTSPGLLLSRHSDAKRVFEDRREKRKEEKMEDKTPKNPCYFPLFYFRALGFFSLFEQNTSPEKRADFLHISAGKKRLSQVSFFVCFPHPHAALPFRVGVWLIG